MKKNMLPLFIALAATTALAETIVFDVSMTVKTTIAKQGKLTSSCVVSNGTVNITYRKQGTIKVQGLIWGCKCESLIGPLGYTAASDDGCYFWNVTDKQPLTNGTIFWPVLHRIDNRMKKAEGVMELSADGWYLLCAGFGKVTDITASLGQLLDLKGYFAGWRLAPTWTKTTYGVPCTFCDSGTADITEVVPAQAWALCTCAAPSDKTAAFGNWTLKYNKNLSKRLNDVTAITAVYTFPTYVTAAMTKVSAAQTPAAEQPAAQTPAAEQPAAEQPAAQTPAAEQPATEQPATEQPATEQPAAEQPATEQPAAGETPAAS